MAASDHKQDFISKLHGFKRERNEDTEVLVPLQLFQVLLVSSSTPSSSKVDNYQGTSPF